MATNDKVDASFSLWEVVGRAGVSQWARGEGRGGGMGQGKPWERKGKK